MVPFFALAGSYIFYNLAPVLSGASSNVRLSREIRSEKLSGVQSLSKAAVAFHESGQTEENLFEQEKNTLGKFSDFSPWAGLFLGASLGFSLISLSSRNSRTEYKPDQGKCFSCGRCFRYCPIKE